MTWNCLRTLTNYGNLSTTFFYIEFSPSQSRVTDKVVKHHACDPFTSGKLKFQQLIAKKAIRGLVAKLL